MVYLFLLNNGLVPQQSSIKILSVRYKSAFNKYVIMEGVRIVPKLKLLFAKLVEPNYVMNNYYADSLINKLSNYSDPGN